MAGKMRNEAGSSSGSSNRGESVVVDVGRSESSCGYCRSGPRTSISHGLWANSITVDDYQDLLDRGWRRSGSLLYKPEMERTCCPSYTIRLRAADFVRSKEQRCVSRRMQRFLDSTLDVKKPDEFIDEPNTSKASCSFACDEVSSSAAKKSLAGKHEEKNKAEQLMHRLSDQIDNAVCACTRSGEFPFNIQLPKSSVKKVSQAKRKLLVEGSEDLLYTSNIAFQIAAALRRAQSAEKDIHQLKLSRHGAEENALSLEFSPKFIAENLASSLTQPVETSGLSIKACNGHINYYSATKQASLDDGIQIRPVSEESSTACGSKGCCLKKSCECPQGKRRRLEIHLKRSDFDPEEQASLDDGVQICPVSEESSTACGSKGCCLKKSCECPQGKRRRLEIRLKRSDFDPEEQASLDDGVQIRPVSEESSTACGSKGCCLKKSCECPQGKRRSLEIRLKRSDFDPEEFALYRRYQIKVHNDTPDGVTESSYRGFLVDTPLVFVRSTGDGTVPPCGFGSFHQQYVIDGRLVAVGVIDILPKCLSSKYFFWDPDFAFLSLGKYSALQEIGWVKENQVHCPSLQYYYLGYYIHSCSKMRYKAAYCPSELLCPLRYQWVPFDVAKPLLDKKPYAVLSDFTILQNGESSPPHSENLVELPDDDLGQGDLNNICFDEDEEMLDSDDESGPETSSVIEIEEGDVRC